MAIVSEIKGSRQGGRGGTERAKTSHFKLSNATNAVRKFPSWMRQLLELYILLGYPSTKLRALADP